MNWSQISARAAEASKYKTLDECAAEAGGFPFTVRAAGSKTNHIVDGVSPHRTGGKTWYQFRNFTSMRYSSRAKWLFIGRGDSWQQVLPGARRR